MEFDTEEDGRIIAYLEGAPGVMAYGATAYEAEENCYRLAESVLASLPVDDPTAVYLMLKLEERL